MILTKFDATKEEAYFACKKGARIFWKGLPAVITNSDDLFWWDKTNQRPMTSVPTREATFTGWTIIFPASKHEQATEKIANELGLKDAEDVCTIERILKDIFKE